jgi:hypothetical protein
MQDLNIMLKLDAQTLKVTEKWPMAPCEQPSSIEMDRAHQRVFVGCRSGVMAVVDGNSGRIVTTQPIGRGVDASEFDADRGLVYFSSSDGTMSVFHEDTPDKYRLVESVKTQTGARTMAIDRKTGRALLSVAEFGPRPEPTPGNPPRAPMIPGSFSILVVGRWRRAGRPRRTALWYRRYLRPSEVHVEEQALPFYRRTDVGDRRWS